MSDEVPDGSRAWLRVEDLVQPVGGMHYFGLVEERFGVPPEIFDPYLAFQPNSKNLWIVRRDLEVPVRPEPHTLGMPFFYVNMRFPRPTSAAAVFLGRHATKNVYDASDDDLPSLIHRREIPLDAEAAAEIDGRGYVLLRHRGLSLGLGFYRPFGDETPEGVADKDARALEEVDPEEGGGWLRGMLPRSWKVRSDVPEPGENPVPRI